MRKNKNLSGKWAFVNGKIYDPFKKINIDGNILIEDGIVTALGNIDISDAKEIDCTGQTITSGFIDIHAHFRVPGREDKETLETGALSAMAGGFTRVCVMPNTDPPLDTPEAIRFIKDKAESLPIQIYPIGAITIGQDGTEIAEYGEMIKEGAVALSDDGLPVENGQVLRLALEYSSMYGVPVINHAEDIPLRNDGLMNESALSTRLGLDGNPDISESVMVFRDLEIAQFVSGRIHIPHVSTKRSVDIIKQYKAKGVKVTAEVTPHHIGLTEHSLAKFDTNAKVAPPLRTDSDRKALIQGLKEGVITCIATDHAPHTIEDKEKDMKHAPCGMIGLESAFALSNTILQGDGFSLEDVIGWLTAGPASVLEWDINAFEVGAPAEITIINDSTIWKMSKDHIYSKSKNSPMLGMEFKGEIVMTVCGDIAFGIVD
ncbi:dihydroorotase [Candidatus Marinimicrobia bacterium]|nr:dihydroorotase [Candidatus Neomarinimicrobiota bacterium]